MKALLRPGADAAERLVILLEEHGEAIAAALKGGRRNT